VEAKAVERIRVVAFGVPHEGHLEVVDEPIVLVDEREIDVDALAHTRIDKMLADAVAVRAGPTTCAPQNWQILAGLSTNIILRTVGSGAQTGNWFRTRPSSIARYGDTSLFV